MGVDRQPRRCLGSVKKARWLEQKEGDMERELRIRTQRIQTPGCEQSKEMSWLLGETPSGIHLPLES